MQTVSVEIPAELTMAAGLDADNLSAETTRLLALDSTGKIGFRWDVPPNSVICQLSGSWNLPAGTTFRSIMEPTIWRRIAELWNDSACDCSF